jgi:glycolate oxidase FAD binding subunit
MSALLELVERVRDASRTATPLDIRGGGSKRFYGGRPHGQALDTRGLSGITAYEPTELFVTVRAGTPLTEVEAALAERGQMLAFEPPRLAAADGSRPGTVGGMVAAGLSGPTRAARGAVRDHVLGATLLNGRGEVLRFGGQVMKNVAGFDVSRLLAGSMGVLGVILDVTLKAMPQPAARLTLRLECPAGEALQRLAQWRSQPLPIDASAWWDGMLVLRLAGAQAAVQAAAATIGGEPIPHEMAAAFWRGLRDQDDEFFVAARQAVAAGAAHGVALWRLSLPGTAPPVAGLPGEQLIEWGGAQRWVCTPMPAARVREIAHKLGGHATRFIGREAGREAGEVFGPLAAPLDRLHRQLKAAFDPAGIFNRGRLFDEAGEPVALDLAGPAPVTPSAADQPQAAA